MHPIRVCVTCGIPVLVVASLVLVVVTQTQTGWFGPRIRSVDRRVARPTLASGEFAGDGVVWWVHVSDTHQSQYHPTRRPLWAHFLTHVVNRIQPDVVLASGDLTDSKLTPDRLRGGGVESEWVSYSEGIEKAGWRNTSRWLDLPGNHDNYGVRGYDDPKNYWRKYGVWGERLRPGTPIHSVGEVVVNKPFGRYRFVGVDMQPPVGIERHFLGIFRRETHDRLRELLSRSPKYNHTVVVGHYPLSFVINSDIEIPSPLDGGEVEVEEQEPEDEEEEDDDERDGLLDLSPNDITPPPKGRLPLWKLLGHYQTTAYLCGHLHTRQMYRTHHAPGGSYLQLEVPSWGSGRFRIGSFDGDTIAWTDVDLLRGCRRGGRKANIDCLLEDTYWPIIHITYPPDAASATATAQPMMEAVTDLVGETPYLPIRVMVFNISEITSVEVAVDGSAVNTTLQPAVGGGGSACWVLARWSIPATNPPLDGGKRRRRRRPGVHRVTVKIETASGRMTQEERMFVEPSATPPSTFPVTFGSLILLMDWPTIGLILYGVGVVLGFLLVLGPGYWWKGRDGESTRKEIVMTALEHYTALTDPSSTPGQRATLAFALRREIRVLSWRLAQLPGSIRILAICTLIASVLLPVTIGPWNLLPDGQWVALWAWGGVVLHPEPITFFPHYLMLPPTGIMIWMVVLPLTIGASFTKASGIQQATLPALASIIFKSDWYNSRGIRFPYTRPTLWVTTLLSLISLVGCGLVVVDKALYGFPLCVTSHATWSALAWSLVAGKNLRDIWASWPRRRPPPKKKPS